MKNLLLIANCREQHLEEMVQGLIPIQKCSIISEYKVMREVLWQLWGPHESFLFEWSKNKLTIKPNVTISSVRLVSTLRDLVGTT